jgi:S-adenosyl-L-methionine hydrolase (adenosine-forming)
MHQPIVTLSSDFGQADAYVAAMKAAILRYAPHVRLIDVSHQIQQQNVLQGSIILERALDAFAPGTIHLIVVDPGVGTGRKILIVQIRGQIVVCPDNGLITWSWRKWKGGKARGLIWRPRVSSRTFHGRDILAPAAGMLANQTAPEKLAPRIIKPILLDIAPAGKSARSGQIVHIDHFGNAITNLARRNLSRAGISIRVGGQTIGKLKKTYSDVQPGEPLALIGSADLLEIALRDGSAAKKLRLSVGDRVFLD